MILQLLGLLALAYLAWSLVAMEINYRRASSMRIPLVRLYVDPQNLLWMVCEPIVWPWLERLPINWDNYNFGRYSRRGWYFADGGKSHQRYGPIWAIITPRDIYVNVADSEAIHDIFQRRTDFIRPNKMYKVLEVYGPCISTASWTDWPRHRKVLATPFNEGIMSFVWDESVEQTRQMLDVWLPLSRSDYQIPSVAKDTRTLSLNVLAATGFHKSFPFNSSADNQGSNQGQPGHLGATPHAGDQNESVGYRDALQTVLDNCILLMVIPRKWLTLPFAPNSWRQLGTAAADFQQYMVHMLNEEIKALNAGKSGAGGLMTSFVRAMDLRGIQGQTALNSQPLKGLTIDEIFGNIFVINFAGHDTTANTLSFGLLLLAAYPEVQDWVAEELQALSDDIKGHYTDLFPRLPRCRAVMLETLRLFPPILSLPKWTSHEPQLLKVGDRTITIPSNVGVHPSLLTMHIHPQHWEDPMAWKPSRWISTGPTATLNADEQVITPQRCTYFPWSAGPQNCPGNKFSQAEFVAVMAGLLRSHRVYAIPEVGETRQETRARVLATTRNVDMQLLLRMKDADQVRLMCRRA